MEPHPIYVPVKAAMLITAQTFRVFVSSTFSDLKAERDHLQEQVFSRLRDLANNMAAGSRRSTCAGA